MITIDWILEELSENIEHKISLIPRDDDYNEGLIDGFKDALKEIDKIEDRISSNKDDCLFINDFLEDSKRRKIVLTTLAEQLRTGITYALYERDEELRKTAELKYKEVCIDMLLILYAEIGNDCSKKLRDRLNQLKKHSDDSITSIIINELIKSSELGSLKRI